MSLRSTLIDAGLIAAAATLWASVCVGTQFLNGALLPFVAMCVATVVSWSSLRSRSYAWSRSILLVGFLAQVMIELFVVPE